MSNIVYIGLGSNMHQREQLLLDARHELCRRVGVILQASSLFETAAWGVNDQPDFLNQVIRISTMLSPEEVLLQLQQIELGAGRIRELRWGPRTLDLDILFYNDLVLESQYLTIPHPRVEARNFVLVPLAEIAGELMHPQHHKTIRQLALECPDPLPVRMWINP